MLFDMSMLLLLIATWSCPIVSSLFSPPYGEEIALDGARGTKGFISLRGGNIRLYRKITKPGTSTTVNSGEVNIKFCTIREMNNAFSPVTDELNRTRVITSLRDQMFNCSSTKDVILPHSSNASADCIDCYTELMQFNKPTIFTIKACLVKEAGVITQMEEVSNVSVGQLKFSIEMTNGWPFCDASCSGGAGKYLEVDVCIRLPTGHGRIMRDQPVQQPNRPKRFNLGGGATVQFSTKTEIDGTWMNLASGYPVLSQKSSDNNIITLRFPTFNEKMFYDPTVDLNGDEEVPPSNTAQPARCYFMPLITSVLLLALRVMY